MHSPIRDLALSSFTHVEPLARTGGAPTSISGRLRAWVAECRRHRRGNKELAKLTARDWAVGDYGISRWQAEQMLTKPFRAD